MFMFVNFATRKKTILRKFVLKNGVPPRDFINVVYFSIWNMNDLAEILFHPSNLTYKLTLF